VGRIDQTAVETLCDGVVHNADIATCLEQCDALATMTSLAGFEALMRGKIVYTYGGPFYAGWGLTVDALHFERRKRQLTIEELAAVTLILYPRYIHPPTGLPCTAEEIVSWLTNQAPDPGSKRWRWFRALWSSLSGARPTQY
jgi:capsular polysaccharide export protein